MSIDYATKHRWQNRVRWRAASALNCLPWTCWTSLVSWALHSTPLYSRYGDGDIRQDSLCRGPSETGRCYCSKIAVPTQDHAMTPGGPTIDRADDGWRRSRERG